MGLKEWVALTLVKGVGPVTFKRCLESGMGPETIFSLRREELESTGFLKRESIDQIMKRDILDTAEGIIEKCEKNGIKIFTIMDSSYPFLLKNIPDPPAVIYVKGMLPEEKRVSVVGTRKPTDYGRAVAEKVSFILAINGVCVVSGMAYGIDAIAHSSSIKAGGRTVAVLGSGLNRIYPPEHKNLFRRICENGAVLSEYPPDEEPHPSRFPERNRLISGLSSALIVVEAGERSGALITARCALEQGRDVFAVPGNITSPSSKGTNRLIKEGANVLTGFDDLSEVLDSSLFQIHPSSPNLTEKEMVVFQCLKDDEAVHPEELVGPCKEKGINLFEVLTSLELKGMIRRTEGGGIIKT